MQVLDRALAILNVLSDQKVGLSLAELSEKLQLHKSTVHRLVMVLERHRLVDKHPQTARYRLGMRLFELGSKAIDNIDLRERCRPHLTRIVYEINETVHCSVLDHGEVLYIEKMEPQRGLRMASSVGYRAPAYCTAMGKAMLALLPEVEVDEIVRQSGLKQVTRKTIVTPADLRAELKLIRLRHYAMDDEEKEEGVRCVGAAVVGYSGRPVAAISVSGPSFRITKDKLPNIAKAVIDVARALSAELGHKPQDLS
ncbi:MAG TPA: IclR family transcriptional regulator [Clostridia bacterium]|nr:IclR family transcriptional regulator [Clostridia bacterium]